MGLPVKHQELVQIVDSALEDAARRAGDWLLCRVGCTQCCHGVFAINELDALRLQAGMEALRGSDPELAAEIERRSEAWIEVHGADYPGDLETGKLGESESDRDQFEEFANEAACPALDQATGRCDVYAWRPMTCRVFGPPVRMEVGMGAVDTDEAITDVAALGHCELCFQGASEDEVKACEMTVPHELEAALLGDVGEAGETVVAFALLR